MRDNLSLLQTFSSETEAQLALNHLLALGITAMIEKDNCGGMRPHLDLSGGVDILVAAMDLENAQAALQAPVTDLTARPWTCPNCSESIEAGFAACWKCGTEK